MRSKKELLPGDCKLNNFLSLRGIGDVQIFTSQSGEICWILGDINKTPRKSCFSRRCQLAYGESYFDPTKQADSKSNYLQNQLQNYLKEAENVTHS